MLTNKICAMHITTLIYFHIYLSITIYSPWTSLGDIVFTQIVSSYNYERLIRSISTPFCLHNIYTHYLYLYFYAPFPYSLYSYSPFLPLFTYTLYSYLYSYASILTPSFTTPSLPTPYYSPLYMYT